MGKKRKRLPTLRQKMAFEEMLKAIETGQNLNWYQIMQKAGFSRSTAINPGANLLGKRGFQMLLEKIDDEVILGRIYHILNTADKDASLKAADMLLKLKDRYPARKSKVLGIFGSLDDIKKTDDENEIVN